MNSKYQRLINTGLRQARFKPAINFVAPTTSVVRAFVGYAWQGGIGSALGASDYMSGYFLSGARPELHLYAHFQQEAMATAVKSTYDKAWEEQMTWAAAEDLKHQELIDAGKPHTVWYITWSEMLGRIRTGSQMTQFGEFVQMNLDTAALHMITNALVDGFYRNTPPAK